MEKICIVSCFLDIGRDKWSNFNRSIDQYFSNFNPYISLFSNCDDHEMILFMDDRYLSFLKNIPINIKILPINLDWMYKNIHAFSNVKKEEDIMNSDYFKSLINHRSSNPECCKPLYNIIQHSKIDLLCHVINNNLTDSKYLAWSDFGYFQNRTRIPKKMLDLSKLDINKINFQSMNEINYQDGDILYTLINAPEKIGGFFYFGRKDLLLEYQKKYHEICTYFYKIGIVDDDQHIMLQCFSKNPKMYHIWNLKQWHMMYLYFQKK